MFMNIDGNFTLGNSLMFDFQSLVYRQFLQPLLKLQQH